MADIFIAKRVIDYVGLGVRGVPESQFRLLKELMPNLSLMQGMGSDGAKLLSVDANGGLLISGGTAAPFGTVAVDLSGQAPQALGALSNYGDAYSGLHAAVAGSFIFNNANWDRPRSVSAQNQALQTGVGVQATALPGQWSVTSNAAIGSASSASRVAGGATVRHILTGFTLVISSQAAPGAGQVLINIRDGASGAGTILEAIAVQIPAALYAPIVIVRSGLSLVGSAATAMTVEHSAAYAAVATSINFEGYDAS